MENKKLEHRGGRFNCPGTEDVLQMDTVLYNGFGGYRVTKNHCLFYQGDAGGDFLSFLTLQQIEAEASKTPEDTWKVILDNPLRGATWERRIDGNWVLIETNQGFAYLPRNRIIH